MRKIGLFFAVAGLTLCGLMNSAQAIVEVPVEVPVMAEPEAVSPHINPLVGEETVPNSVHNPVIVSPTVHQQHSHEQRKRLVDVALIVLGVVIIFELGMIVGAFI